MKKKLSFVLSLLLFIFQFTIFPGTSSAAEISDLNTSLTEMSVPAQELVNDITLGWNLGNSLDVYSNIDNPVFTDTYETGWNNPVTTKKMIDTIKQSGINAIRVPVTWYLHMDENNNIDETWMNRVQEIVDYVIDNDMYCIINVHHDTGTSGWLKTSEANYIQNKDKFQLIWEQIADRFCEYDERLMFEGFNEMISEDNNWNYASPESITVINKYNQLFVDTIRAKGGKNAERCLICNTYGAQAYNEPVSQFQLPDDTIDNRLIAQVHCYSPGDFCFSTETKDFDDSIVTSLMSDLKSKFTDKNIPLIIGEYGCVERENSSARIRWYTLMTSAAKEAGIKCFLWDNGTCGDFGLYTREACRWKEPELMEALLKSIDINVNLEKYNGYNTENGNLTPYLYQFKKYCDDGHGIIYYDANTNGIMVKIDDSGTSTKSMQAFYTDVELQADKKYKITFEASCNGIDTLPIDLGIAHVSPSFKEYYKYTMELSNQTRTFEYIFNLEEIENYNFNFVFFLGNGEATAPYDVTISNLMVTEYTESSLLGDVDLNGTVNNADLILLQNYLLGNVILTEEQWKNADIIKDENVNIFDITMLKRRLPIQQIELNGKTYALTLFDNFNGTSLNTSIWSLCPECERADVGGYWDDSMTSLDGNGNLVLSVDKDIENNRYISGGIRSKGKFEQTYGYFEARCKLQEIDGFWSAFWLMGDMVHNVDGSGEDGTEIDIMESVYRKENKIGQTLHYDGYESAHQTTGIKVQKENLYSGYHVFGLEWTPTEYIFYVDGEETWRTNFGDICKNPLYLKLTTEIGTWAGTLNENELPGKFLVDYVKVYTCIKEAETPKNMISSLSNWYNYANEPAKAAFTTDEENHSLTVNVTSIGNVSWDVQSHSPYLSMEQGKCYKLTFDAYSTASIPILIAITHEDETGTYVSSWNDTAQLTPNNKQYTYTFTMEGSTADNWFLNFNFGDEIGNYTIQNITLTEVTE